MSYSRGRNRKIFMHLARTAVQSIPSGGAASPIVWTKEESDTYGFHATDSNEIVIPVGVAGFYTVTIAFAWGNNGLGYRALELWYSAANGSGYNSIGTDNRAAINSTLGQVVTNVPGFQLQEGDKLQVRAFQSSGIAVDVNPTMHMVRIT